jgi:hypothetical protein
MTRGFHLNGSIQLSVVFRGQLCGFDPQGPDRKAGVNQHNMAAVEELPTPLRCSGKLPTVDA